VDYSVLPPEVQVVLLMAAARPNDAQLQRLLEGPIDWGRLLAIAQRQGATAAVWRRLGALAPESVPGEVGTTFRRLALVAEFKQARLEQRLFHALDLLASARIRVLLLKGAALGLTLYERFADRPMADVDLLVDPERAGDAQELLLAGGWVIAGDARSGEFYEAHQHLAPLGDAAGSGVGLELHTDLFFHQHPFHLPLERLWAESRTMLRNGREVQVPSANHLLLHTCLHFAWSHMASYGAWRTFRDLHEFQLRNAIDWASFCEVARAARAATCCYWALRLARVLASVQVPDRVLARLSPPGGELLLAGVERHLVNGIFPLATPCPSVRLAKLMWKLGIRPGWSGHSGIVPWQRSEVAVHAFISDRPVRGGDKLHLHLRNLDRWRHYLATVLGSAFSAPTSPRAGSGT
jgi:hypothetical protein